MDVKRAKEIVDSPDSIEVRLNGSAVWIDSVDETTQTATVHEEQGEVRSQTVRVDQLQEMK